MIYLSEMCLFETVAGGLYEMSDQCPKEKKKIFDPQGVMFQGLDIVFYGLRLTSTGRIFI